MKPLRIYCLLSVLLFFAISLNAQVTIGAESDPNENAVLELISNDSKGLLLPRLELQSTDDPAPLKEHVEGMVVYNTGTNIDPGYYYNDGVKWILITSTQSPWRDTENDLPANVNSVNIYQSGTIGIGTSQMHKAAQLDVSASDKGVLLPRLTSDQRDAMDPEDAYGLLIYNLTTNCFNYYVGGNQKWISLCGSVDPADFDFLCVDGKAGSFRGTCKQGTTLTENEVYTVSVNVSVPGNYSVLAASGNGYSFGKTGTFTEPGNYTLDLVGQGTPINYSAGGVGDVLTFYFNGVQMASPSCTQPLPPVVVVPSGVSYTLDCSSVSPQGSYQKDVALSSQQHYITIPISVTGGGSIIVETNQANGFRFSSGSIAVTDQTTSITLYGQGIPAAGGVAQFNIDGQTCPFSVTTTVVIGTFASPAKNCLEIYNSYTASGGAALVDDEYWISYSGNKYKTFCDMTNGGYTMVYSFSERQAYGNDGIYWPAGMGMGEQTHQLYLNKPRGLVQTENGSIMYHDYRLPLEVMKNLRNASVNEYRVRIAYLPTVMKDLWANENYIHFMPSSTSSDPLLSSFDSGDMRYASVFEGRIMGLELRKNGTSNLLYDGTEINENAFRMYNRTYAATHWDCSVGQISNMGDRTVILPKHPDEGGTFSYTFNPNTLNNMFGWFAETQPNHHMGKCQSGTSESAQYTTSGSCFWQTLVPHDFNGGQGRYLQWWIK